MNDHIRSCKCFYCDIEKTLQYVPSSTPRLYRCHECEYESQHRGGFEQCWVDNHTISEQPSSSVIDEVNSPPHYNKGKFQAIDVMEDWFHDDPLLFTALKYLARCKHKGNLVQDLRKAIWYIERRITKEEEDGK